MRFATQRVSELAVFKKLTPGQRRQGQCGERSRGGQSICHHLAEWRGWQNLMPHPIESRSPGMGKDCIFPELHVFSSADKKGRGHENPRSG